MLLPALVLVPLLGALAAYLDRSAARRSLWIVVCAVLHLGLVALAWCLRPAASGPGWLAFDPLGGLVLTLTSVVFLAVAVYSVGYQRHEPLRGGRAYASCLLAFLAAASVITLTRHFGLLWVAMEATTLATAPLIYDPADRRSLEAVWKYLVVCSVGIAVALLGIFFLATAQVAGGASGRPLVLEDLVAAGPLLHPAWLRGSFVFVLIGFGTKMGLAPMHTWLPDAHGEAPSPISALLSGALLNLAFLAILRELAVLRAAGQGDFAGPLLVGFGLFSVAVAAAFLFGQGNYKRMLAYSSVEHMGILAVGAGLAGVAAYGALLHVLSASLAKALLFLVAGNVWQGTGTKRTREVTGLARRLPVSAALLVAGFLAISGSPPFGPFLSEFTLLTGAVRSGATGTVVALLTLQALIFISMGSAVLGMVLGPRPAGIAPAPRESLWLVAPPAALLALVLLLGVWIPEGLRQALAAAAAGIGGHGAMKLPGPEGFRNRHSIPWGEVPCRELEEFRGEVVDAIAGGARLVSFFGLAEDDERTRLVAVLADDERAALGVSSAVAGTSYPALTPECPQAHLFEREIAEQCGVTPEGHPWLKPVRRHPPDHLPSARRAPSPDPEAYPFFQVAGEEVHEVAVGPVHAGIIEPGHFRFQAHGEDVLFLEIVLGYQHRGVERLLETLPPERAMQVAESIAGDTVIGHAEAFCGAFEALSRCRKPPRAQSVRGCALELERLANHIGDLGALAGDVAFAPTAAICGRVRGDVLNLLLALSGNRFGRGLARPGGVGFDLSAPLADELRARLGVIAAEFEQATGLFFGSESVQARIEGTGVVPVASCRELGFVGPTARASGLARDVRQDHPWGIHRFAHIPTTVETTGDVAARAMVRTVEARRSFEFLQEQLAALPRGEVLRAIPGALAPGELVVALAEGWRGEIAHVALTDDEGRVRRWKVTDPSFHDWTALAVAMAGTPISDFPLCNKSFNLSYAGHDL